MAKFALKLSQALSRAISAYNVRKYIEAEKICQQIINAKPDFFDALHLLAVVQSCLGKKDAALATFDRALTMQPDSIRALSDRGVILNELKRCEEALADFNRALKVRPNSAETLFNRGVTLHELKCFEDALVSYDRALTARPDYDDALFNRGLTLNELRRFEEALASFDRVLTLRPHFTKALSDRGIALHALKRFEEALASFDRALAVRPDFVEALSSRGVTLKELKRFEEALASFDRALRVRPDFADAHWNEALLRLLIGDFGRGWAKFEWRWKNEALALPKRVFSQPLWLGADAINGKAILLHSEQGLGDAIQFCRYVPLVAARGARVILEVERPLQELMTSLTGATQVISRGDPPPPFDIQCPLLSLPLAFGTEYETIPSATPYLHVPVQASKNWQARLGPKARPRIGLVWSGNPMHKNDHNRSISLRALIPLLDIEATFVSLQRDVRSDDAAVLTDSGILHFGDELRTFSDTAALISNLDLVISVDTSVAHLAGALATPCWLLLPLFPDWRWLLDRSDSPWYPTTRLFRQDDTRTWDNVIARVHTALYELVQCRF
jgi:tetratricopeptide (TPR) repeat protein